MCVAVCDCSVSPGARQRAAAQHAPASAPGSAPQPRLPRAWAAAGAARRPAGRTGAQPGEQMRCRLAGAVAGAQGSSRTHAPRHPAHRPPRRRCPAAHLHASQQVGAQQRVQALHLLLVCQVIKLGLEGLCGFVVWCDVTRGGCSACNVWRVLSMAARCPTHAPRESKRCGSRKCSSMKSSERSFCGVGGGGGKEEEPRQAGRQACRRAVSGHSQRRRPTAGAAVAAARPPTCSGVPVRSSRCRVSNWLSSLNRRASLFFRRCPSSTICEKEEGGERERHLRVWPSTAK